MKNGYELNKESIQKASLSFAYLGLGPYKKIK